MFRGDHESPVKLINDPIWGGKVLNTAQKLQIWVFHSDFQSLEETPPPPGTKLVFSTMPQIELSDKFVININKSQNLSKARCVFVVFKKLKIEEYKHLD